MRFRLCVVGKPRDPALAAAIAEYESRAARYWPLDVREIKATSGGDANIESRRLSDAAGDALRIVCDERGKGLESRAFAQLLQSLREQAKDVALIVGGAFGVSDELRGDAHRVLALAPWTLPHELARLVLAEQLYRAGTILKGEPYHK
ncbi:MAG: 23S rRNA (pseudouridine(1915)-N(3))-methyltransferase RlmH [Gemmatimonadaceae bacterium]